VWQNGTIESTSSFFMDIVAVKKQHSTKQNEKKIPMATTCKSQDFRDACIDAK
jgi:hypothetical protein